jgi:hypothetical protein
MATRHALTFAIALAGGFLGAGLRSLEPAYAGAPKLVTAEEFRLVNASGKTTAQLATSGEGSPCLFLFDKDGHARAEIGCYGDGMPFVVLNDPKGQATGIFRNAGSQESPVLVLKAQGRDRMIVGLQMDDKAQEPFIEYYDAKGAKHEFLGKR